jgi:hypothetical protein
MNQLAYVGDFHIGDRVVTIGRILGPDLARKRGTVAGFIGDSESMYRTDDDAFPVRIRLDDRSDLVSFALHEIRKLDPIELLSELA